MGFIDQSESETYRNSINRDGKGNCLTRFIYGFSQDSDRDELCSGQPAYLSV